MGHHLHLQEGLGKEQKRGALVVLVMGWKLEYCHWHL